MAESDPKASTLSSTSQSPRRLDSWKEIAAYLSRDVTTVRRWEKREALPVHRHRHAALGSVYAFTSEIDAWQSGRDQTGHRQESASREEVEPIVVGGSRRSIGCTPISTTRVEGRDERYSSRGTGIGKTSLVRAFLHAVKPDVRIAVGQCVEQHGAVNPICRSSKGSEGLSAIPVIGRRRESSSTTRIVVGLALRIVRFPSADPAGSQP
jgi:hypothetical protein